MIRFLKQIVKRLLASFGLIIFKRSTGIYIGENEIPSLALRLCGVAQPVIIDGGAHEGAFVDAVRALCPAAQFLCFEPDPSLANRLRYKYSGDPGVQIVQSALGSACGSATFNINQSRACNSLAASGSGTTGTLGTLMTTLDRIEVEVTTLDDAMRMAKIPACNIIKLDLQGHDLPALQGGVGALGLSNVVIVEVWYAPVYTNTVTYLEIFDFLRNRGFSIYALAGLHYSTADRLLWSDAVFLRSDSPLFKEPVTIN